MTLFMIAGGKVMVHDTAPAKPPKHALLIGSAKELEASKLPASRLLAIWNALPGVTPVAKFKDRKAAVRRLWAAFQELPPPHEDKPRRAAATGSKQAQVIEMLRRAEGATVDEIATATGWQRHTVRGMISGALKKKLGLNVVSAKDERGRVYRIADVKQPRA